MPKLINRPSEEEVRRATEDYDKKYGNPYAKLTSPEEDQKERARYERNREARQKRVAEWKRLADPNCAKCGGNGSIGKTANVFDAEKLRYEGPNELFSSYDVACSCTYREET